MASNQDATSTGSALAVFDDKLDSRELRKAAEAIHIATELPLAAKKAYNHLVYRAYSELISVDTHKISITDLARDMEFDSNNTAHLKRILRMLVKSAVEYNLLNNGAEVWRASTLLSEVEISGGMVSYSFPPQLRKMLYNPKVFSMINLQIQNRFSSNYAWSLYENCYRFKRIGTTGAIDIALWKRLLGVDPKSKLYQQFKYFNSQILGPAIKEVNEKSDVILIPDFERVGKSIVKIRFEIQIKAGVAPTIDDKDDGGTPAKMDVLERMLALGVSQKAAATYFDKHAIDYLLGNLEVVEQRIRESKRDGKSKISSPAAYFRDALEKDYRPAQGGAAHPSQAENASQKGGSVDEAAKREEEEASAQRDRIQAAREYYDSLAPAGKAEVESMFKEHLLSNNRQVHARYIRSGLDSKITQSALYSWIAENKPEF